MVDYIVVAKILKEIMNGNSLKIALVNTLARYFEDVDPKFNKKSFKRACNHSNDSISTVVVSDKIEVHKTNRVLEGLKEATDKMPAIIENVFEDKDGDRAT